MVCLYNEEYVHAKFIDNNKLHWMDTRAIVIHCGGQAVNMLCHKYLTDKTDNQEGMSDLCLLEFQSGV